MTAIRLTDRLPVMMFMATDARRKMFEAKRRMRDQHYFRIDDDHYARVWRRGKSKKWSVEIMDDTGVIEKRWNEFDDMDAGQRWAIERIKKTAPG